MTDMRYTTLGRTGLHVSVLGLGAGGHSRLGQSYGRSPDDSIAVVRRAQELGVNFFDTAEGYNTEALVGAGVRGRQRDHVVLSTKKTISVNGALIGPEDLTRGLEESLRRLGTDHVDVYHLHGVPDRDYDQARDRLVPVMMKMRDAGKLTFLGITEAFGSDCPHQMMSRAVLDDCWDVVMVGFNILNQSARPRVLAHTRAKNIGVLDMFAVRSALSQPEMLRQTVAELVLKGAIDRGQLDGANPLGFLLEGQAATSIPDAAYRFCRDEPGVHVVLCGTGSIEHLEQNVASILRPALPQELRDRLMRTFEHVDSVSGQ